MQHFLGLAGTIFIMQVFNYILEYNAFEFFMFYNSVFPHITFSFLVFPLGPFIDPIQHILAKPVRHYFPILNRNLIGVENRKRTVIYQ